MKPLAHRRGAPGADEPSAIGGRLAAAAFLLVVGTSGCGVGYVLRQASGQLRISRRSVALERALADPAIPEGRKAALRQIGEIRAFAEREMGMAPSRNYTTYYAFEAEALAYALTACPADSLEPYTWRYPIVGRMTYRGDFSREHARREAQRLRAAGYDVWLRPVRAYSTLGWFRDPIVPFMLDLAPGARAELVLHELTHGVVYAKGHTSFNESLASFAGRQGARGYLDQRYAHASREANEYELDLERAGRFQSILRETADELRTVYASPAPREEKLRRKAEVLDEGRARLGASAWEGPEWNNAFLVANLTYEEVEPFARLFEATGRDWPRFWKAVRECARARDPWAAVRAR